MKKRKREISVQFYVNESEEKEIHANMERNGLTNRSDFMRILALSRAEISFSVKVPNILRVSEAALGSTVEEARPQKRAAG